MLDDPAWDAVYEAIADAANAAAGDGAFNTDDANSFLYAMSNFGDLGIAENNVTYYNADGTVRCECEYEGAGAETVAFDGEEFDWHKFELTPEDTACSEYKYLIFTEVHSHEGAMVHFHMRYGNTRFDDLINNTNYTIWYPTFAVAGTTVEDVVEGYAAGAEMMGAMMLASQRPTVFAGGDGTTQSPYQIATAVQLDQVRNYLDKNFILTADIDLAGYENWQPIGVFQAVSEGNPK